MADVDLTFNQPQNTAQRFFQRNRIQIIMYSALAIFILFVAHLLSDRDFSFLLTLGSIFRLFAFALVAYKLTVQRSAAGLSLKTLQASVLVSFFRLCSILVYDGYLPYDKSGDWFYQMIEIITLLLAGWSIFQIVGPHKGTYNEKVDAFGNSLLQAANVPASMGVLLLVVPSLVLALLIHPSLNNNILTDCAWMASNFLEAVAIIPQLDLLNRGGEVEAMTSHSIFAQGAARVLLFVFWLSSFRELTNSSRSTLPGWFVVISQVVNLVLLLRFLQLYLLAAREGRNVRIPLPR